MLREHFRKHATRTQQTAVLGAQHGLSVDTAWLFHKWEPFSILCKEVQLPFAMTIMCVHIFTPLQAHDADLEYLILESSHS